MKLVEATTEPEVDDARAPGHVLRTLRLPFPITPMERVFWTGITLMVAATLVFEGIGWLEARVFGVQASERLVANGSEAAMRYLTLPHFVLAFLFSVTATRNRSWRGRAHLGGLLVASFAICWAVATVMSLLPGRLVVGSPGPMMQLLVVLPYFLWHEMRDEAFFYRQLGDRPAASEGKPLDRLAGAVIGLTLFFVLALFGTLFALGVKRGVRPDLLAAAPPPIVLGLFGLCIAVAVAGMRAALGRYARTVFLRRAEALRRHAPLFRVYAGLMLTIVAGVAITGRGHTLALAHVCIWYVFVCRMLERRRAAPGAVTGWWPWLRGTATGFRCLHHGTVAAVLALGMFWVYGLHQQGWLWYVLSPSAFYYWTIVHITVSFQPR